jgi:hypothetical protein
LAGTRGEGKRRKITVLRDNEATMVATVKVVAE